MRVYHMPNDVAFHSRPPSLVDTNGVAPLNIQYFFYTYGPIFSLLLGIHQVAVVSSGDLEDECFITNDVTLSNWPLTLVEKYVGYDQCTTANVPYDQFWRTLCHLASQEALNLTHINAFHGIGQDEVKWSPWSLIMRKNQTVELRFLLFELIFNVVMRMLTEKRYSKGETIE